jgi:hypothetical protein
MSGPASVLPANQQLLDILNGSDLLLGESTGVAGPYNYKCRQYEFMFIDSNILETTITSVCVM